MATHSSTLAWKIPWTEEPGRLQSMGLQRVGHNWSDTAAATAGDMPLSGEIREQRGSIGCLGSQWSHSDIPEPRCGTGNPRHRGMSLNLTLYALRICRVFPDASFIWISSWFLASIVSKNWAFSIFSCWKSMSWRASPTSSFYSSGRRVTQVRKTKTNIY